MGKFYSISIHGDFANVLHMEKKKNIYKILDERTLDLNLLHHFLEKKHSFYIVIDTEEVLDDVITIPSALKSPRVLKSYVLKRFKDSLPSKNIFLNYTKISENKEDKTTTYKIDAINQKEYVDKLLLINEWREIQSATIDKFALLSMTQRCFKGVKDYGYFSVYTHHNLITILAIDEKGHLLFDRTSTSAESAENSKYLNIVEEINQTIAYVQQQFRGNEFSTLLISGSLAIDDQATEHLLFSTNLAIAILYPNTFISGLEHEEPQHYIITLGASFVKKQDMFLPDKVHSIKEYHISIIILMFISTLSFIITSFLALEQYTLYSNTLQEYDNVKERLFRVVRSTETYSMQNLKKSYQHLQIAEKFLKNHPTDTLLKLKPLIELLPPSSYDFDDHEQKTPTFKLSFVHQFTHFTQLYQLEKEFLLLFNKLNTDNDLEYKIHTNYTKMKFSVDISNKSTKKPTPQIRRRRR